MKNQEKVVGPIIHCSPDLTRTISKNVETISKKGENVKWQFIQFFQGGKEKRLH